MDLNKPYLTIPHPRIPIEIREISEDEFNQIKQDSETIYRAYYYLRRLRIIEQNRDAHFSIKAYYTQLLQENYEKPIEYDFKAEAFLDLNRCLINYVSSFKALVEHCEKKVAETFGKDSLQFASFKGMLSTLYDNNINYRLLYNLRNFSVHKDFPIEWVNYDRIRFSDDEYWYEIGVFFSKEKFQGSRTFRTKMGRFLDELEPKTQVCPFLNGLIPLLKEVIREFISIIKPEFFDAMERIQSLSKNNRRNELSITRPAMVTGHRIDYNSVLIPIHIANNLHELTQ